MQQSGGLLLARARPSETFIFAAGEDANESHTLRQTETPWCDCTRVSFLFTNCFVGQHCFPELQFGGFSHCGVLLSQAQALALLIANVPLGQILAVGVAGSNKVTEIADHLL